ncbi:hypothetical protein L7F22_061915 [Adiantum nelumboides]|nr:hypothetical protein [Adiantum nelumboides]
MISVPAGLGPAVDAVVAQDGSGDFLNVSAALQNVPANRAQGRRYVIYIKAGIYQEVLLVPTSHTNLSLIGDGIGRTIITGNRSVGSGLFNTLTSAIVHVAADGFFSRGITFRNTAGPQGMQAVAMLARGDMTVFHNCSFEGYQDILWAFAGRYFFRDCTISGTIDFIFGDATAVFQNCELVARLPLKGQQNAFTAQGRSRAAENTEFVFHNCRLSAEGALLHNTAFPVATYLGRPWQDFSRVVFLQCHMDALVHPAGWLAWNASNPFTSTLFYGEFQNRGPGAAIQQRVLWKGLHSSMTLDQAVSFSVLNFLKGDTWLSSFPVPFDLNLTTT